jgi:hypothetical protein
VLSGKSNRTSDANDKEYDVFNETYTEKVFLLFFGKMMRAKFTPWMGFDEATIYNFVRLSSHVK